MLDSLPTYVAGALLVTNLVTGVGSWHKNSVIEDHVKTIGRLEAEQGVFKANEALHLSAITKQNEAITKLQVDLNASNQRWNSRVPAATVVERWRTRYVDVNTTGGDCENNKLILDAIHDYGY